MTEEWQRPKHEPSQMTLYWPLDTEEGQRIDRFIINHKKYGYSSKKDLGLAALVYFERLKNSSSSNIPPANNGVPDGRGFSHSVPLTNDREAELLELMQSAPNLTTVSGSFGFFEPIQKFIAVLRHRFLEQKPTTLITDDPKIRGGARREVFYRDLVCEVILENWEKIDKSPDLLSVIATAHSPLPYVAILTENELWLKQLFIVNSPSWHFTVFKRTNVLTDVFHEIGSDIHQTRLAARGTADWNLLERYRPKGKPRRA